MKKYYYKNSFNDTVYSNDPNIPNATPVKLIYNCAEIVNREGISSYDSYAGGTAPWFCIKDGNVEFYAGFLSDTATNTISSISKKYYRRIFTYTQDSLTNSWWITGDSSWAGRRKIPLFEKKELFEGTNPVICVQNRFDDDENIIGNKLSWKISPDNMKYYPTIGGPYPSFNYYIKYINPRSPTPTEQYYCGNPAETYDSSMWTTNYNQKTIFYSYNEAETLYNQMGDRTRYSYIVNPSQDDATSACNFKSEYYASYTMSGFLGWGDENSGYMPFTPSNWCSIVYPPTAIENTEFDFTPKMISNGASPSYFTLDISKVPTKYTKLDVVIDGVFYYPYNNDVGPQVSPITDKNNIFNAYNFGEPLDYPTYNCWAYLYKPDNEENWNYEYKYALSAKKLYGQSNKNVFYSASLNETYQSSGWITGSTAEPPVTTLHRTETEIENFINQYSSEIEADTIQSTVGIFTGYKNLAEPCSDYLGNAFFGNIKYKQNLTATLYKTPFYNDNKTHYEVNWNTFYDNSNIQYSLLDEKVYDSMLVYCVNINNNDIVKFSANIEGEVTTGYTFWANLVGYCNCSNVKITAYSASNTTGIEAITSEITGYDCPVLPFSDSDNNDLLDYRDYFNILPAGNSEYARKHLSASNNAWRDISSRFIVFGASRADLDNTTQYLYAGHRLSIGASDYSTHYDDIPSTPLCKISDYENDKGYWNEYGFTLTSFQVFTLSNVTMRHQIDLGSRTSTGGFTFPDKPGDYRYLHVTYPATNTVRGPCSKNLISQIDMYYKFSE